MVLKFYIVGSALTEKEPRDVDMFGVMEDSVFKSHYGMTAKEFEDQCRGYEQIPGDGKPWSPELTKWKEETMGDLRALQFIFPQLVPLDFKYLPESLLQEPNRRIDITASPRTWGIGLPNLENHGIRRDDDGV